MEGSSKPSLTIFFLKKTKPSSIFLKKQQVFSTLHIDTQPRTRHEIRAPPHQAFTNILRTKWFAPHRNCTPCQKMAAAGMDNKKIATTLGLPQSTTKRWLCRSKTQRNTRQHAFDTMTDSSTQTTHQLAQNGLPDP